MVKDISYREVRGRLGFFGWVWRILLLLWQAAMIAWFIGATTAIAPMIEGGNDVQSAGAALGLGFGWAFILFFWVGGTIILGLFVLLTKRTKAMVPVERD